MIEMQINGKVVDDYAIEFDYNCGPDDYAGWIDWAMFTDGTEATEEELDWLTNRYPEAVDDAVMDHGLRYADFRD